MVQSYIDFGWVTLWTENKLAFEAKRQLNINHVHFNIDMQRSSFIIRLNTRCNESSIFNIDIETNLKKLKPAFNPREQMYTASAKSNLFNVKFLFPSMLA